MSPWNALKADTHRQYGCYSYACLLKGFILRRSFRPVVTMRACQAASRMPLLRHVLLPLCRVAHRLAAGSAMMDLPWNVRAGPGIILSHGWGLVVNEQARIGANVTIFHGVTIGRRDRIARDGSRCEGYPVLEDEVWVGPNAIIIGQVTIGRGARIGGGAFVTDDVPAQAVVVGNPAVIVKEGGRPDVMNPAPV